MCGGDAEDSIEHYARCNVVQRVAKQIFKFAYPAQLGLNVWLLNTSFIDCDDNDISVGLLIYGVYNAFNTLRYNPVSSEAQAFHCIVQMCKEGAIGDPKCMAHLDNRWQHQITHIC